MTDSTVEQKIDQISDQLTQLIQHVAEMRRSNTTFESRFDGLEGRFDRLEERFDNLESRFDGIEVRFVRLEVQFDSLEGRFASLDTKVNELRDELKHSILRTKAKIDHFAQYFNAEIGRTRLRVENEAAERMANTAARRADIEERKVDKVKVNNQLNELSSRLDRVEATLYLKGSS